MTPKTNYIQVGVVMDHISQMGLVVGGPDGLFVSGQLGAVWLGAKQSGLPHTCL